MGRLFSVLLLVSIALPLRAQLPGTCQTVLAPHDKSSLDSFMKLLGPGGAAAGLYAVASKNEDLQLFAASTAAALAIYNYFQKDKTVQICTPPAWLQTKGTPAVKLIGTPLTLQPLAHPDSRDSMAFRSLLDGNQMTLSQLQAPLKLASQPILTGDAARLRGYVTDLSGRRLSGVLVQATPVDQSAAWIKQLTNWDGAFELIEAPGKYLIYAHANGYRDFSTIATKTFFADPPLKITLLREYTR